MIWACEIFVGYEQFALRRSCGNGNCAPPATGGVGDASQLSALPLPLELLLEPLPLPLPAGVPLLLPLDAVPELLPLLEPLDDPELLEAGGAPLLELLPVERGAGEPASFAGVALLEHPNEGKIPTAVEISRNEKVRTVPPTAIPPVQLRPVVGSCLPDPERLKFY